MKFFRPSSFRTLSLVPVEQLFGAGTRALSLPCQRASFPPLAGADTSDLVLASVGSTQLRDVTARSVLSRVVGYNEERKSFKVKILYPKDFIIIKISSYRGNKFKKVWFHCDNNFCRDQCGMWEDCKKHCLASLQVEGKKAVKAIQIEFFWLLHSNINYNSIFTTTKTT